MRKLLMAGIALVLVACGDDSGTDPDEVNLAGTWTFSASYAHAQLPVSCEATGSVTIAQSGDDVTGTGTQTGTCDAFGGDVDISGAFTIADGQMDGDEITFTAGECSYTGTVSGNPPNRMSGTTTCTRNFSGQNLSLTGTWEAER